MVYSISNIWFMSQPAVKTVQCLLHSAEFAAILWLLAPWGHPRPAVYLISACVVLSLYLCCVCSSIPWHCCPCRQQFLTFPFPSPNCRLSCAMFISIYLFYLFIHLFMFSSTEPFGSSVTGAKRGLGARDLQLDCGLGRPVGCSSTLGCDCSCSSWAPWAPSLHL